MSVCFFNSFPNNEYSNLLIIAAFSNSPYSSKNSLPVRNSYLPTFLDGNAKIFAVYLCKLY